MLERALKMGWSRHQAFTVADSGASRNRTGDLLGAIQALSHLSYSPAAGMPQAASQAT